VDLEEDNFGGFAPFNGGGGNFGGGGNYGNGGGNNSGGFQKGDNPQAGLRNRDLSDFGGSKMFIPGGFQTLPSKANNFSYDDDDINPPFKKPENNPDDGDVPF